MNPVGITRIGKGRWSVIYSNGETKPVSYMWSIVPHRIRTYMLYKRYMHEQSFDVLVKRKV